MKVMTIFGTRPEIIRLSLVLKILDQHCEHVTVHTGQNYHESLSDIFIKDLARPDREAPLLDDGMDASPARWTPDGRLIYQGSDTDGRYTLRLVRPGSAEPP